MASILKGDFNIEECLSFTEVSTEGVQQEETSDGSECGRVKARVAPGVMQGMVCVHLSLSKCL